MTEIVVLSGKGGTGKTAIASSLAALAERAVLADADVDAANLSLVLSAERIEDVPFYAGESTVRQPEACGECYLCRNLCRFEAIGPDLGIDAVACEGCGLCARVCPEGAIRMVPALAGRLFVSRTPYGTLVHARLEPGEENCGKLAARVKERAREVAAGEGAPLLLVDGPPGTGCPAIATLSGADLALFVTEPGVSGRHDLLRILDLARHFGVPTAVVVNRWDVSPEMTRRIEEDCARAEVPVVGRVPFDRGVVEAVVRGVPFVTAGDGPAAQAIRKVRDRLRDVAMPRPGRARRAAAPEAGAGK